FHLQYPGSLGGQSEESASVFRQAAFSPQIHCTKHGHCRRSLHRSAPRPGRAGIRFSQRQDQHGIYWRGRAGFPRDAALPERARRAAGVACFSSHFGIEELRKDQEDRIAWAKDFGLTQMLVPSLNGPKNPTLDDMKRSADEYNKMGEKAARAGIQQGLHNEDFELSKVDGQRTYD